MLQRVAGFASGRTHGRSRSLSHGADAGIGAGLGMDDPSHHLCVERTRADVSDSSTPVEWTRVRDTLRGRAEAGLLRKCEIRLYQQFGFPASVGVASDCAHGCTANVTSTGARVECPQRQSSRRSSPCCVYSQSPSRVSSRERRSRRHPARTGWSRTPRPLRHRRRRPS